MKNVIWSFCGGTCFEGLSDNTKWNGFSNIWVNEEWFLMVLDDLGNNAYNGDWDTMLHETFGIGCGGEFPTPNKDGLYCFGYGFTTHIEDEIDDLKNKCFCDYCDDFVNTSECETIDINDSFEVACNKCYTELYKKDQK